MLFAQDATPDLQNLLQKLISFLEASEVFIQGSQAVRHVQRLQIILAALTSIDLQAPLEQALRFPVMALDIMGVPQSVCRERYADWTLRAKHAL